MSLLPEVHAVSQGEGRGRGFFAAFIPSKWYMLSYARNIFAQLAGLMLFKITKSQERIMMNT